MAIQKKQTLKIFNLYSIGNTSLEEAKYLKFKSEKKSKHMKYLFERLIIFYNLNKQQKSAGGTSQS